MVNVAIAGGTSATIGRSIISALLQSASHTPIILSHLDPSIDDPPSYRDGVPVRYVQYESITSLFYALSDIHTVICTLRVPGPEMADYQINLLNAAITAGVKRFVPSEFDLGSGHDAINLGDELSAFDVLRSKVAVWDVCRRAMEEGKIQCARFNPGMLMNYFGLGCPPERREEVLGGLSDRNIIMDVLNGVAEIPDSNWRAELTVTEVGDVGRFVAAVLDLEEWPSDGEIGIVGQTLPLQEFVELAERVRGKYFTVTRVSREEWVRRAGTPLSLSAGMEQIMDTMIAQHMVACCDGRTVMDPVANRLCPQIRPMSIAEYMQKAWG
ncbi:MAG: hypothetical protein Q9227_007032 [Pyrenula ochraceoflavens]